MPDEQPTPLTISNLEPASAHIGDPELTVHAIGTGFTVNSLITADRVNLATTFHSDTDISATITPFSTVPGMSLVTVKNGSEESNSLPFNLMPPLTAEQKDEKAKAAEAKLMADTPQVSPQAFRKAAPPPPPPPPNPDMAQGQRSPTVPPRTAPSKK